ncbi:conserved hypothetical protein [Vibrio jasicida]|uniref:Uncharacterized protein n=1 Tax=Vibrio jasicida TaxID=766224 RepID=A0AAU9QQ34_9VIBR|nr:hypothetical protein [Vibrio alginolyticus]CAH1592960.1 conserved hypothetical protein [Vibrio jasicida]CAH1597501.1 conserved hypothetical protein [Vibrio jasicida]
MFINKAKSFNRILHNYDTGAADRGQVEFSFELHRKAMKFHLENKDKQPGSLDLKNGADHINQSTGIKITPEQLSDILALFPSERIKLAEYGISDTEVREGLYNVACCFFSGCEAPAYDEIDIDRFIKHLQEQAVLMGYTCSYPASENM